MDLLTEELIETNTFKKLSSILKCHYLKINHLNSDINYNNFNIIVCEFTEKIMEIFLKNTQYKDNKYRCLIRTMPPDVSGRFIYEDNRIIINDYIIKMLYSGDIMSMKPIFHELNHFRLKYEILSGKINRHLIRIVKENLIRELNQSGNLCINNNYYLQNYDLYSEEKVANLNSVYNLINFLELNNIKLPYIEMKKLYKDIQKTNELLKNNIRHFNDRNYDFEEVFDILVRYNKEWLRYPQINIEYYVNKFGKIEKRSNQKIIDCQENNKKLSLKKTKKAI